MAHCVTRLCPVKQRKRTWRNLSKVGLTSCKLGLIPCAQGEKIHGSLAIYMNIPDFVTRILMFHYRLSRCLYAWVSFLWKQNFLHYFTQRSWFCTEPQLHETTKPDCQSRDILHCLQSMYVLGIMTPRAKRMQDKNFCWCCLTPSDEKSCLEWVCHGGVEEQKMLDLCSRD